MASKKYHQKYYFTVDGETEQWYFDWLQNQINAEPVSKYTVTLDCAIQDPKKRAKSLVITKKTIITHICDYESNDDVHTAHFQTVLDRMKESRALGKQIDYKLGYSNFTFELWIALHKIDCCGCLDHRKQYLAPINRGFSENFRSLDEYKRESNFKRVLEQLSLEHVKIAINRSENIMKSNEDNGLTIIEYKGYKYYRENPSLSIWEVVKQILTDCQLV
ncbi:MAG: RloB domain-containing protein [Deltaproteobacteria bacterium]